MGKINKRANIYKNGECLRHVEEDGRLHPMTIEEVENLVDKLGEDKDDNGHIKDPISYRNAQNWLIGMYNKYGNPHQEELLAKYMKPKQEVEIAEKLNELKDEIVMDSYVDFEEVA